MKEYLLQHNVTMFDFWVFVGLFIAGVTMLVYFWRRLIKEWKDAPKEVNFMTFFLALFMTGIIGPLLLMGAVHFIQMVLFLI